MKLCSWAIQTLYYHDVIIMRYDIIVILQYQIQYYNIVTYPEGIISYYDKVTLWYFHDIIQYYCTFVISVDNTHDISLYYHNGILLFVWYKWPWSCPLSCPLSCQQASQTSQPASQPSSKPVVQIYQIWGLGPAPRQEFLHF